MSEQSDAVKKWRRNTKLRIVKAMGGCCQICGYNKCPEALDLHHLNPNTKEINFGKITANPCSWDKKVVPELRKCILLCSNCHREYHSGYVKIPETFFIFDESFSDYRNDNKELTTCEYCGKPTAPQRKFCSRECMGHSIGYQKLEWDDKKLKNLLSEGLSNIAISKILGCSETSVRKRLKKIKLSR